MIDFTARRATRVPIEAVFETLTDHRAYSEMTALRSTTLDREGTPPPNGLGAIRRFSVIGPAQVEEITIYEPPTRFRYELRSGLPVSSLSGTVTLHQTGGETHVEYHVEGKSRIPGVELILSLVLRKAIGDLLGGVIAAAERRGS